MNWTNTCVVTTINCYQIEEMFPIIDQEALPPAPKDQSYIKRLPRGARKIAEDLTPVFSLFGMQPDFTNFFKTLEMLAFALLSEEGLVKIIRASYEFMFHKYDNDNSGAIDSSELLNVVKDCLILEMTTQQIEANPQLVKDIRDEMMAYIDVNHDGTISIDEFLGFFMKRCTSGGEQSQ